MARDLSELAYSEQLLRIYDDVLVRKSSSITPISRQGPATSLEGASALK
jgi:hypothetical protein